MTAERWVGAAGGRVGLGRLLPLGGPRDGAWIAEEAAGSVLRRAAEDMRGVRLGALRIALADPEQTDEPVVPPPPGALPPGPLRIGAECAVAADPMAVDAEPLPRTATRLRALLATTAVERLGLTVAEVDLRVTDLLDGVPAAVLAPHPPSAVDREPAAGGDEATVAAAALSVPGVVRLTGTPVGPGRAVHIEERHDDDTAPPRRHVRMELAVAADRRAVDVARAVRGGVTEALLDRPSVTVVVTAVAW
jgi:hypothetical protein